MPVDIAMPINGRIIISSNWKLFSYSLDKMDFLFHKGCAKGLWIRITMEEALLISLAPTKIKGVTGQFDAGNFYKTLNNKIC